MGRRIAERAGIAPFHVMEVMKAADRRERLHGDVLHLEVGQPSTPAPAAARAAVRAVLDDEILGYTDALGRAELRHRIARWYGERHDLDVSADRIAVTQGASGGCVLAFLAAFDVGDRVAVPSPGYPCYRNMLSAAGIDVVDLPVDDTTRFQPAPELLDPLLPLDGLVVASPSNPTGTALDPAELDRLLAWSDDRDVRVVADEIYHGIQFDRPVGTAAGHGPTVVVNSFSKYFSMTGWRVGWLVLPEELVAPVERLAQNLTVASPTISQVAALGAFGGLDELEANVARYAQNRAVLLDGLPTAGLADLAPCDGAFYVYADITHLGLDSQELCTRWLDELGVAATPGIDFDPARGHRSVRFSFSGATTDMIDAVERLRRWTS